MILSDSSSTDQSGSRDGKTFRQTNKSASDLTFRYKSIPSAKRWLPVYPRRSVSPVVDEKKNANYSVISKVEADGAERAWLVRATKLRMDRAIG